MALVERIIQCMWKLSDDAAASRASREHVQLIHSWVMEFLAKSNDALGRAGPVCPFARPSMDRDLLWVAVVVGTSPPIADAIAEIRELTETFLALPPDSGPDSLLKAVVIAFPDVVDHTLIDKIQRALKSDFVEAGLMIGQFYQGCTEPGLWNPQFRPLESPVPLVAIRHMVSNDFPFLNSTPAWIEAYLRRFAPTVPSPVRAALAGGFGNASTGSTDIMISAPDS